MRSCSTPRPPRRRSTSSARSSSLPSGREVSFAFDHALRDRMLNGLDDIALTLQREDEIAATRRSRERPGPSTLVL